MDQHRPKSDDECSNDYSGRARLRHQRGRSTSPDLRRCSRGRQNTVRTNHLNRKLRQQRRRSGRSTSSTVRGPTFGKKRLRPLDKTSSRCRELKKRFDDKKSMPWKLIRVPLKIILPLCTQIQRMTFHRGQPLETSVFRGRVTGRQAIRP